MNLEFHQSTGKRIQNYVFSFADCIGKGNFSKVYKAYHQVTNEVFAIKIIQLSSLNSRKLQELLFSQIDVLKKLNHPNVLRCYEVFTSNRHCYIITQLCNQGDLQSKLRRQLTFTEIQAEPLIRDIFSGLLYLSEMNIVHRDIKVANVFLHNGRAKIADFGFAKFTTQKWRDVNIGSPIYMSPQGFIDNIYGPKTDVWAFGVMLYEFFHGQSPFARCKTESELRYNITIPLNWGAFRSDLSPQIKQVILRCMEVNQQRRCTFNELKYTPYIRRLLEGGHKWINQEKILHVEGYQNPMQYEVQVINSNMNPSFIDRQYQNRARNLVQTGVRNQKVFSPLGIKPNNIASSPNQSLSLEKFNYGSPKFNNNQQLFPAERSRSKNKLNPQQSRPPTTFEGQDPLTPQSFSNRSSFIPLLISSSVTFKQCVNLLHYCRLLYKYITFSISLGNTDQNFNNILTGFLLACLNQISDRIDSKGIFYQGQNAYLREKKLREVTDQYTKKYTKELGSIPLQIGTTLAYIKQTSYSVFINLDQQINVESIEQLIMLGHCALVIWHSTRLLQQCYQDRSYQIFGQYKQIETLLNKTKNGVDYYSFENYKQKLID